MHGVEKNSNIQNGKTVYTGFFGVFFAVFSEYIFIKEKFKINLFL